MNAKDARPLAGTGARVAIAFVMMLMLLLASPGTRPELALVAVAIGGYLVMRALR